ncbi:MAG: methionyl-tRNA formyltransferase [Planctomycetales bacterium]|nr:methionyl-tRNA formyltransferase [Planctomycetales bacterium]
MRIILLGTGPFAVPTCQRILDDGHDVPLVVTRPLPDPKPKKLPPRPVHQWATEKQLPIFEPHSINDSSAIQHLHHLRPDLLFVCDYGQILSRECLATAHLGGINLHGSILPRHRGAAPVQWALLRGDQVAGITVIHMTPKLDAGPALAVRRDEIQTDDTAESLEPRLAALGPEAVATAIDLLSKWDGNSDIGILQDRKLVTKAPRFQKADGQLDCRLPAEYLVRLVKACQPWPSTFAQLSWANGKSLRVQVRAARSIAEIPGLAAAQVGAAAEVGPAMFAADWLAPWDKLLAIKCSPGFLLIGRIQPDGRRVMDAGEFLRGHDVQGAAFECPVTPIAPLD